MLAPYEQLPAEAPPEPKQLDSLLAQLILFAQRHGKLRIRDDVQRGYKRYRVPNTGYYEKPEIVEGIPFGYLVRPFMGALALRYTDEQQWSLRIFDQVEITELGSQRGTSKTTYSFDWTEHEVRRARRRVSALPDTTPSELMDVIDTLHIPDDADVLPRLQLETERMSAEDVDYLAQDISQRIAPVDEKRHAYNHPRGNYLDYFAK